MPAADRELAAARAEQKDAQADWRLHRKACHTCAQLRSDRWLWCPAGYDLRVRIRAAEREVAALDTPPADQLAMF